LSYANAHLAEGQEAYTSFDAAWRNGAFEGITLDAVRTHANGLTK